VGQIRLCLTRYLVPVNQICQKERNSNCLEYNGFKQDQDQVPGLDVFQLKEGHTKQNKALDSKNTDISYDPVRDRNIKKADNENDQ
jgi:hypothetical protein